MSVFLTVWRTIVSGKVAPVTVNVDSTVEFGRSQMAKFELKSQFDFNSVICKVVQFVTVTTKHVPIRKCQVIDKDRILNRIVGLHASYRSSDKKDALSHELVPMANIHVHCIRKHVNMCQ